MNIFRNSYWRKTSSSLCLNNIIVGTLWCALRYLLNGLNALDFGHPLTKCLNFREPPSLRLHSFSDWSSLISSQYRCVLATSALLQTTLKVYSSSRDTHGSQLPFKLHCSLTSLCVQSCFFPFPFTYAESKDTPYSLFSPPTMLKGKKAEGKVMWAPVSWWRRRPRRW